jgi:hypothetical protein
LPQVYLFGSILDVVRNSRFVSREADVPTTLGQCS